MGGTGWAVTMAAQRGLKEIYVFDQYQGWWKLRKYVDKGPRHIHWHVIDQPPIPEGHYTGIGSRKLTPKGESAIIRLYEQCK